jgi:5'-nucleotidase
MAPLIAITNDDGIDSPGLLAAAEAAQALGRVVIIAPTYQQTGMGRSLTGDSRAQLLPRDIQLNGSSLEAYHCACSPALVVRFAMQTLFSTEKPDLLISGINYGENLGNSVTCSGTVGAALEACNYGIKSIAISKQTEVESHNSYTSQDWGASSYFLSMFGSLMLETDLPPDVEALKIDVPDDATTDTQWKITRLARTFYYSKVIAEPTAQSRVCDAKTQIVVDRKSLDPESDIYALAIDRVVSVTPLSLDLTSRVPLSEVQRRLTG